MLQLLHEEAVDHTTDSSHKICAHREGFCPVREFVIASCRLRLRKGLLGGWLLNRRLACGFVEPENER